MWQTLSVSVFVRRVHTHLRVGFRFCVIDRPCTVLRLSNGTVATVVSNVDSEFYLQLAAIAVILHKTLKI